MKNKENAKEMKIFRNLITGAVIWAMIFTICWIPFNSAQAAKLNTDSLTADMYKRD